MHYLNKLTITTLICLLVFSFVETEVVKAQKNIKIPVLPQSDTIKIAAKPGYYYDIRVYIDTIGRPRPLPPKLPPPPPPLPIKIVTQPGYQYDVRIGIDTIGGPSIPIPLPGPFPQITTSLGPIVKFNEIKSNEFLNIHFMPTISGSNSIIPYVSDIDTIGVDIYYKDTDETVYIPCLGKEYVKIPCQYAPGGVMLVPCGSYIECGDSTSTDQ